MLASAQHQEQPAYAIGVVLMEDPAAVSINLLVTHVAATHVEHGVHVDVVAREIE